MTTRALFIHGEKDLRVQEIDIPSLGAKDVRVRIKSGGICGSDLHYYLHGGFGTVRLREPMVLGHEIAGIIEAVGSEVEVVKIGDKVAVNPSRPCYECEYCQKQMHNHCVNMRFYGSAMPFPHVQGAFRDTLVAEANQCIVFPQALDESIAVFAEPLSVALHAAKRFGDLEGKDILVTGCGPIGALAVLVARVKGANRIVVTDVADESLVIARELGANLTINVAKNPEDLLTYVKKERCFDGLFEASGNERALCSAIELLQPKSRMIQIGLGGEMTLPLNRIVAKELELCGTFRFHEEFPEAVQLLASGGINVQPLLTDVFPMENAIEAFELAGDRSKAMKVQLSFES
ncbi:MAG: L-idonate 5-dehydrogenase [Opitutaceae bacterium]|nr:L-idonate 5-dehydrogenase [Opitutaceae bacterium]